MSKTKERSEDMSNPKPPKPPIVNPNVNILVPTVTNSNLKCVYYGLNDYPGTGNDLQGCVNDATDWCDLLSTTYKHQVVLLRNQECLKSNVVGAITDAANNSNENTQFVFGYSGHGTNVADKNGDEEDGRDEALCLYDGLLIDDELRVLFGKFHPQARITVISDSCHSGTVTRQFMSTLSYNKDEGVYVKPKFLPPSDVLEASVSINPLLRSTIGGELGMNEVLISGCSPIEYSYDARINGRFNGAMTWNSIQILKATPAITFTSFHSQLRKALPNANWPQTPQLEGRPENKNRQMFV